MTPHNCPDCGTPTENGACRRDLCIARRIETAALLCALMAHDTRLSGPVRDAARNAALLAGGEPT